MILYPAIDLKDGQCVRVVRGDLATATVFNASPADQAMKWSRAGFSWLHVVDLNGSVAGRAINDSAVKAILAAVSIPIQLGGGIRSPADVAAWMEAGVGRVILGTAAVSNPALVKAAARRWPGQIAVSVDVRKGRVAVEGWTRRTALDGVDVARRFEDTGVCSLIVTDIARDGAQTGFDIEVFGSMADAVAIPVIAAGGLARVEDIVRLRARPGVPIAGAVLGRALYAGAIDPARALGAASG
ncbi:MAG TPA: 1-(5-phosphoribosyl)-5-[(5-phosphoribosylamino)methylideneamino]imidazole-4-carboxamide isomerase [Caulobacteraceae bacterium]